MMTDWQSTCALVMLILVKDVFSFTFHLPKLGGCPDLAAQKNFIPNIDKFVNTWFVQSSFDTEILQGKGRCMTATYKYNPLNKGVSVATQQFNEDNNKWERLNANAALANESSDDAKFTVTFTIPNWTSPIEATTSGPTTAIVDDYKQIIVRFLQVFGEVSGTYSVLGTDYETYSVIHGCGSFFSILHYDCSWLMSRKQKLSAEEDEAFYKHTSKVLEDYETLKTKEYQKVDQVNCEK